MSGIKYVHTNIVAKDWKALADFYIEVFDCKPLYPKRDLSGQWIDNLTNIKEARIRGMHLSLPGYENGPTLEIFKYTPDLNRTAEPEINEKGFGHIAFLVDSVEEVLDKLLEFGGTTLGEVVKKDYEGIGKLTAVYAKDPEGNFVEIQNWVR